MVSNLPTSRRARTVAATVAECPESRTKSEPIRAHHTDVTIACQCPGCAGREATVTLRRYRNICRLPSPGHELAVHQSVSAAVARTQSTNA